MRLLRIVASALEAARVPHALVGAGAMAAHGVGRSTLDLDLFTTAASVLSESRWSGLSDLGIRTDVRRGDLEDPLAGVVRFDMEGESPVDLVVGRSSWQEKILQRAVPTDIGDLTVPVATAADLILLKLYAGGSQDSWDVEQLLAAASERETVVRDVRSRLSELPPEAAALWARLTKDGS
ncbi:MAG TPA: hypothetical protein VMN82_14285 [Thermoanaerobaculia bacterium]|nr:hypothetical protein [Thermoanaerobaculia bacterium]